MKHLRTLDLTPQYTAVNPDDPKQLRAMARIIAKRLSKLETFPGAGTVPFVNNECRQLIDSFNLLARYRFDAEQTLNNFNELMVLLFRWADRPMGEYGTDRACLIIVERGEEDGV